MGILKKHFFIIIIILGFFIRVLLLHLPGFKIDVDAWFAWSERLVSLPLSKFYSDAIWTNYTPGYLYILYFLGILKHLFSISSDFYYQLLKLPSIISEIILAIFVYKKILNKNLFWAKIAALIIILNPAFIFNSALWGQIDGLLALSMVLAIYFLEKRNLILASAFWGVSLLIKPQAIALLPVFGIYMAVELFSARRYLEVGDTLKDAFKLILPATFVIFIASLPFFPNQPLGGVINLFSKMIGDYSFSSLYAYNFWGGVGFWIPDNIQWFNLSYQIWGYILYTLFWLLILIFGRNKLSVYSLAALATLSFFFLPTRVHERYLYPAIVFLIIVGSQMKSYVILIATLVLSMIHFLNLYFVYVYYNEFYLNLPHILYNLYLYNFLDSYGTKISVFSTVIFIFITVIIVKSSYVSKKD